MTTLHLPATWMEKLLQVTSAFSRARTAREVGEVAVTLGVEALGAASGALGLVQPDGHSVEVLALTGRDETDRRHWARLLLTDRCPATDAVREAAAIFVESAVTERNRYPQLEECSLWHGSSQMAVPLLSSDRPSGYVAFGFAGWVPLPPDARAFAQALAAQATQALERARLLEQEQKARRRLESLATASEAFSAPAMSTPSILETVVRRVCLETGDMAVLRLVTGDGKWLEAKAWWAPDPETRERLAGALAGERHPLGEGLAGCVAARGETLLIPVVDDETFSREYGDPWWSEAHLTVHSFAIAPLRLKGRVIGTLAVARARPGEPYGEDDRLLLEGLSARAASGIDRTRLYEEVVRSQRIFEGIAEASPDLLYLFDLRRGRSVYVSRSIERLLGRSQHEIAALGDRFIEALVHPDDQERLEEENARFATAAEAEMVEHEYRMRHADGSWRWMRSRDRVFSRDASGAPELLLGVARDVTEHVRAEHDREELLAREQQARQEAETASQAKDQFLAMLGHELRNPLSPMITALDLMRLRGGDAFERERTIIERQVQHLVRLVDDLLDVSRITRGKVQLRRRPLQIGDVVASAIEMSSPLLESRSHRLEVHVPRSGLPVLGDPARLAQVFGNLLTNAAKYTEPNGKVEISAAREGDAVVVRIRDSGMGIAPELAPRIFDLFVQGKRALDRSQGGLGLGLTIVRSLVEMHGGAVRVASEGSGMGSEFSVRLPLLLSSEAYTPVPSAMVGPGQMNSRQPRRVLVVDDNQDAADALVEGLVVNGFDAAVAYDAPGALDAAARTPPDVAFLDIGLPVMDGYELARRLREQLGPDAKLVALTGYGQERDRAQARAAGFDEHLVKPVDLDQIMAVLQHLGEAAHAMGRDAAAP